MPRVYYSTIISAPIEEVWKYVRDFNSLPKWHPGIKASEIEGGWGPDDRFSPGIIRHFELADGSWMREQLISLSDADFSITYSILETAMKLKNYVASLSLAPIVATDETFAEWEAVFDSTDLEAEEETEDIVYGVFSSGLENLDEMLIEEMDLLSCAECAEQEECEETRCVEE